MARAHSPALPPPRDARRGYVVLFVIIVLLLIAVLSITYMRVVRMRMIPIRQAAGGADRVTASALDQAMQMMADDMPVKTSEQEDYDYPWTDAGSTLMPATLGYPAYTPGLFTRGNPKRDDAWLASGYIQNGQYAHLTNLMGSFLDVADSDLRKVAVNPTTHNYVPADKLSANTESNVSATDKRLMDADGDGVPDSLPFYPPISQLGNVRYVAACYIEDLSAKVNLNVATPLRAGGSYAVAPLKGLHPGEADLSALSAVFGATDAELAAIMKFRTADTAAAPWNEAKRHIAWGNFGSRALLQGDPLSGSTVRYSLEDEKELRRHGGLNDGFTLDFAGRRVPVVATVESAAGGAPALLRASDTALLRETDWSMAGLATAQAWTTGNPRKWVTTLSGEADRQIGLPNSFLGEEVRYNLNIRNDDKYDDALRDWTLSRWFAGPNGTSGDADDYPFPVGFNRFVPTASSRPLEFARQLHASLIDARDKDNRPTESSGWYGWENLPMLSEVYMQSHYRVYGATTGGGGNYTVNCDRYWADASYAFEIVNPYDMDIKLVNLYAAVHRPGIWWTGASRISDSLAGWADLDADNDPVLKAGHTLILWRSAGVQNGETSSDISAMVNAAVAKDPAKIHAVNFGLTITDPGQNFDFVRVELICESEDANGGGITRRDGAYSFITVPWLRHSFQEKTTSGAWASSGNGTNIGYRQVRGRATGLASGLNILQCRPGQVNNMAIAYPVDTAAITGSPSGLGDMEAGFKKATEAYDTAMPGTLGDATKITLPGGRADLSKDKLFFTQNWNAASEGQFDSVMDMLRVPAIGFKSRSGSNLGNLANVADGIYTDTDVGHMLYELLEDGTKPLSSLCMPIEPGSAVYNPDVTGATHRNVPWGWLLHCMYDTVNPAMYGGYDYGNIGTRNWFSSQGNAAKLDANGNNIKDWTGEADFSGYLVPGRINLNTMPEALLRESLPIKDSALRTQLAAAIVRQRDSAPVSGVRASTDRGLSSPMEILPAAAMLAAFPGVPAADRNGDGTMDYKDAARYDLAASYGCLSNMASCRSDFFAMHILVQGYDATDFRTGPIESQRTLILISRAPMTSAGSKGQIKTWLYKY